MVTIFCGALSREELVDYLRCISPPDMLGVHQLNQMSIYSYRREVRAYTRFSGRNASGVEPANESEGVYYGLISDEDLHPGIDRLESLYSELKLIRELDNHQECDGYQWQDVHSLA